MARETSAGLLVFRRSPGSGAKFLLVHPGGPFCRNKDDGAWSIPKGLVNDGEDHLDAAMREFAEEVGLSVSGDFVALKPLKQKSGKTVVCWAVEADLDLAAFKSNEFELEWPPRSGRFILVPECDRACYFRTEIALQKILPGQRGFIEETHSLLQRLT
jgi:predicted NUDIX family NTP pyrophosphohydrolase